MQVKHVVLIILNSLRARAKRIQTAKKNTGLRDEYLYEIFKCDKILVHVSVLCLSSV